MMSTTLFNGIGNNLIVFFSGATGLGILSHIVDTFPTDGLGPKSLWLLGNIKYIIGQRSSADVVMTQRAALLPPTSTPTPPVQKNG